jgi:hypothetical protein
MPGGEAAVALLLYAWNQDEFVEEYLSGCFTHTALKYRFPAKSTVLMY